MAKFAASSVATRTVDVLDEIKAVDQEVVEWLQLEPAQCIQSFLKDGNEKPNTGLSTIKLIVALHIDAQSIQCKDSLKLFCRMGAMDTVRPSCPPELQKTLKAILRKCTCLPAMTIFLLGGLLPTTRNLFECERVCSKVPTLICPTVASSSKNSSQSSKPCFLYTRPFLEDQSIFDCKLIGIGILKGLISRLGGEMMEDAVDDYSNKLIERNMVHVTRMSANDDRVDASCTHVTLLDQLISKAKVNYCLDIVAIHNNFSWYASWTHLIQHLCSLFFLKTYTNFASTSFKSLRVLELDNVRMHRMPGAFREMHHMSCLRIRHTNLCLRARIQCGQLRIDMLSTI